MNYRPEVDGLRSIAVLPVIFFHAGFGYLSGGFLGVDVFFVISGYLITTIILSEMDQGKFSIIEFYERRARRILPALFLVMSISIPFAWLWMVPSEFISFSNSLTSIPLFSSNILFWLESGYFDTAAEMKPLLHTWSLAVEEQFYVFFPLFLMIFWRLRKRWIFASIFTLGILSLLLSQLLSHSYSYASFNFYMLPTRAWELMAGSLVAFFTLYRKSNIELVKGNRMVSEILGVLGLLMIFFSMYFFDKYMPLPSFYTMLPVIGCVLVLLYSSPATFTGKILSSRILVGVGLISYSLYLWHQPLFVLNKHRTMGIESSHTAFILIILTFTLAYLSWKFVERPFRKKRAFSKKRIFVYSLLGSLFFVFIGSVGHFKDGFKDWTFWFSELAGYQYDNRKLQQDSWNLLREISGDKKYGVENNDYDKDLWFTSKKSNKNLLIVGNSHSKDLFNVLSFSDYANFRYQLARFGTQIKDLNDFGHPLYMSKNYAKSDVVMLASRFSAEDVLVLPDVIEKIQADDRSVVIVNGIFDFWYDSKSFKNLADYQVFKERSRLTNETEKSKFMSELNRIYFEDFSSRRHDIDNDFAMNEKIRKIALTYNLITLDRMEYVCNVNDKFCYAINEQLEKYFYDYGHHTLEGAKFFGKRVDDIGWLENLTTRL